MGTPLRWRVADDDPQQPLFQFDGAAERRKGLGEFRGIEFLHVRAKTIINPVPASSRMPFRFTINAYRGCSHACVYCFARPTHEFLNLGIGSDFESKIVVKVNAVERLEAEVSSPRWNGDAIAMGTNTDPYQRAEGKYQLTRGIVGVLSQARNPFSVLTKSTLVLRDADLIAEAAARTSVQVNFSIPTLDDDVWRTTEPGAPHPAQRVAALKRLSAAGVECGVLMAPILPGLSDGADQMARVVDACVDAGATWVAASPLHLRPGVKEHWMAWLAQAHPELVSRYQQMFHGRAYLPPQVRKEVGMEATRLVDAARRRSGVAARPRTREGDAAARPRTRVGGEAAGSSEKPPDPLPLTLRAPRRAGDGTERDEETAPGGKLPAIHRNERKSRS